MLNSKKRRLKKPPQDNVPIKTPDFTDNLLGIVQCQGSLEDDPENTPLFVSLSPSRASNRLMTDPL